VSWDARKPGTLKYTGAGGETELSVVQRSIELPSEKGWGGNELISLTVSIVLERERERKRQDRDRREREERQRGKRERERREREERDFLGGGRLSRKKKVSCLQLQTSISIDLYDKQDYDKQDTKK
jgi:hypothetical protein